MARLSKDSSKSLRILPHRIAYVIVDAVVGIVCKSAKRTEIYFGKGGNSMQKIAAGCVIEPASRLHSGLSVPQFPAAGGNMEKGRDFFNLTQLCWSSFRFTHSLLFLKLLSGEGQSACAGGPVTMVGLQSRGCGFRYSVRGVCQTVASRERLVQISKDLDHSVDAARIVNIRLWVTQLFGLKARALLQHRESIGAEAGVEAFNGSRGGSQFLQKSATFLVFVLRSLIFRLSILHVIDNLKFARKHATSCFFDVCRSFVGKSFERGCEFSNPSAPMCTGIMNFASRQSRGLGKRIVGSKAFFGLHSGRDAQQNVAVRSFGSLVEFCKAILQIVDPALTRECTHDIFPFTKHNLYT